MTLEHDADTAARKRLFLGLITGSCLVLAAMLILLWWIPSRGFHAIHPWADWLAGALVAGSLLLVAWAWLALTLNILLRRPVLCSHRLRGVIIKLLLPLMTLLARLVGVSKERVRNSFIKVNNELVRHEHRRHPAGSILLLLPHCLQSSRCAHRLTYDIRNCQRCGACPIDGLLALADRHGVRMAIATGGTIARRIVVQTRPRLIVAVACERDLASGIQDAYPIPVYGVLNDRPAGPCLDTQVSLASLTEALERFIDPALSPPRSEGAAAAILPSVPGGAGRGPVATTGASLADSAPGAARPS